MGLAEICRDRTLSESKVRVEKQIGSKVLSFETGYYHLWIIGWVSCRGPEMSGVWI